MGTKQNLKKKMFCNQYERLTYQQAINAAEKYGAQVFSKVRVADCLDINQMGLTSDGHRYALSAHFDFVICSRHDDMLFAIECDGPQHWNNQEVIKRDKLKNSICEIAEFPLLRIDDTFLDTSLHISLLSFLIECWFLHESFENEQSKGNISLEEPFDPINLRTTDGSGRSKPLFDIISSIRQRIEKNHGWPPFKNTAITEHLSGRDEDRS